MVCEDCKKIVPLVLTGEGGDDVTNEYVCAGEFLCGEGMHILATTYNKK